jgi:hypothetical protein
MTMIPLIAFVTDISGVWRAGVTFQTTCQPTTHARMNTVRCGTSSGRRVQTQGGEQRRRRDDAEARGPGGGLRFFDVGRDGRRRGQGSRGADLDARGRPHQLPLLEDQHPALDLVVEVEGEDAALHDVLEEVDDVRAVELARLPREPACEDRSRR